MGLTLTEVLKVHDSQSHPNALADNLGDGYLLKNNAIYRNIRNLTLKLNFKFSKKRFKHYDVHPQSHLEDILKEKTIPYLDNVTPLKKIQHKCSPRDIPWAHQGLDLRSNFLFHEACHAVADSVTKKHFPNSQTDIQKVFRGFLEESYVNAVKDFLLAYSDSKIQDEFILRNSYITDKSSYQIPVLKNLLKTLDQYEVFIFLTLSFLCSNYLFLEITDDQLTQLIDISFSKKSNMRPQIKRSLKAMAESTLDLYWVFRTSTPDIYFHLIGIKTPYQELYDFDFLNYFKDPKHQVILRELANTVLK